MSPKKEKLLSAEIVLHSESGKAFRNAAITSENIAEYLPAPNMVSSAREAFTNAGFEVSQPAGLGFSVTAPQSVFEKVFKVKLAEPAGEELPAQNLSAELAQYVAAATFSRPLDFGPGNY